MGIRTFRWGVGPVKRLSVGRTMSVKRPATSSNDYISYYRPLTRNIKGDYRSSICGQVGLEQQRVPTWMSL